MERTIPSTPAKRVAGWIVAPVLILVCRAFVWWGIALLASVVVYRCAIADQPQEEDTGRTVDFSKELIPALTQAGCNAGACHGAAAGRGYLALSLYGSRPAQDYRTLVHAPGSRFIDLESPTDSLLLRKPSGYLDHGGGVVLDEQGSAYRLLRQWIDAGCPPPRVELARLVVTPATTRAAPCGEPMEFDVQAIWSDGSSSSALPFLRVDGASSEGNNRHDAPLTYSLDSSRIAFRARTPGYWPVTIRFGKSALTLQLWAAPRAAQRLSQAPTTVSSTGGQTRMAGAGRAAVGAIDVHINAAADRIGMSVAGPAPSHLVARRLYLDLAGRHPGLQEWQQATAQIEAGETAALVDRLLDSPDFWQQSARVVVEWVERAAGHASPVAAELESAVAEHLQSNDDLRDLVRAMLQVAEPQASDLNQVHRYAASPGERCEMVFKAFLGVRIGCAQCHDHPLDHWTQDDYFGLAACWAEIESNGRVRRISGRTTTDVRTGQDAVARLPDGTTISESPDVAVTDWICHPSNRLFVGNLSNRIWYWLMGTSLVSEVDDQRATNPPVNPDLHRWLGEYLVAHDFSIKALVRAIVLSDAYARSSAEDSSSLARRLATVRSITPIDIPLAELARQALGNARSTSVSTAESSPQMAMMQVQGAPMTDGCTRGSACENPVRQHLLLAAGSDLAPIIAGAAQSAQLGSPKHPARNAALDWLQQTYQRLFGTQPEPALVEQIKSELQGLGEPEIPAYLEDVTWSWLVNRRFTHMY
ncbi:MAG: DUF1549 domain-containing protein [Planctomycetota bacterium]|nr:MAG: DUF1549 domain-containing protein [Planctomycetota bacterium]